MDAIQEYAAQFLNDPSTLVTMSPYLRQFYHVTSTIQSYLTPLIKSATQNPDLASIALILVILFISLKILNMLWQTVVFWVGLARRVVVWGGLVALALWMYSRGPDGVWEDVMYWKDVWSQERDYWRERERAARMGKMGRGVPTTGWF